MEWFKIANDDGGYYYYTTDSIKRIAWYAVDTLLITFKDGQTVVAPSAVLQTVSLLTTQQVLDELQA